MPKRVAIKDQISISDAWNFDLVSMEQVEDVVLNGQSVVKLKDGKQYTIVQDQKAEHTKGNYCLDNTFFQITGVPSLETSITGLNVKDEDRSYIDCIRELTKKYGVNEKLIEVALDIVADQPIDKLLAKVWESYWPLEGWLGLNSADLITKSREYCLRPSLISEKIYASYNRISWPLFQSGVVVLQSNPLGIHGHFRGYLPLPFENKGEHSSIDLTHKDTLVIGPQALLSRFRIQPQEQLIEDECEELPRSVAKIVAQYAKNIRFVYLEDLNNEQLKFLDVPRSLHPQKVETEIRMKKIFDKNTMQHFFNKWRNHIADDSKEIKAEKKSLNKKTAHVELRRLVADILREVISQAQHELIVGCREFSSVVAEGIVVKVSILCSHAQSIINRCFNTHTPIKAALSA